MPSDPEIIKKAREMFPHLEHRAMRVRKYDPALTVAESVMLESRIGRKDCTNLSAVKEFRERFPETQQ